MQTPAIINQVVWHVGILPLQLLTGIWVYPDRLFTKQTLAIVFFSVKMIRYGYFPTMQTLAIINQVIVHAGILPFHWHMGLSS